MSVSSPVVLSVARKECAREYLSDVVMVAWLVDAKGSAMVALMVEKKEGLLDDW